MVDAWPDDLPHGVIDFETIGGGAFGGAFGGLAPAIGASPAGPHWRASVSQIVLHTAAQIAAARALEGMLDGGAGVVEVPCCDPVRPNVVSAAFAADHAAGETDIALNYDGDPLRGGEYFSPEGGEVRRLHCVVELLGGSPAIYRITPPLRESVTAGQAVDFRTASCAMQLESGFALAIDLQRFGGVEASFTEYFPRSPAIAPTVPDVEPEPSGDARYWRVRAIHTHDGDATFKPSGLGFLDSWAGSVVDPVTPISSTPLSGTAARVFDGDPTTVVVLAGSGGWVGQDNGVPKPRPTEFVLTSGALGDQNSMPSALAYEEGADDGSGGITWTAVKTFTDIPLWWQLEPRYFAIGDEADASWASPPLWRRQRVRAISVLGGGAYFSIGELRLLDDLLDTTTIAGTYAARRKAFGTLISFLFDNDPTTYIAVDLAIDSGFDCDTGKVPRAQVVGVRIQAVVFFGPAGAPTDFVFEGSNWEGKYHQIARFPSAGPWPGTNTFTIP